MYTAWAILTLLSQHHEKNLSTTYITYIRIHFAKTDYLKYLLFYQSTVYLLKNQYEPHSAKTVPETIFWVSGSWTIYEQFTSEKICKSTFINHNLEIVIIRSNFNKYPVSCSYRYQACIYVVPTQEQVQRFLWSFQN